MARTKSADAARPAKTGRFSQFRQAFTLTRRADPAVVVLMLLAFVATILVSYLLGYLLDNAILMTVLSVPLAFMMALLVLARRAQRAAYRNLQGQPGASLAAMKGLRRGWAIEETPVAIDPRTQDFVFRAVGRPGVVLVTEGPLPRVQRLAEQERKRISRVLGPNVPVIVMHAGDGEGQIPLPKLSGKIMRQKPALTKTEVIEVSKRLKALGGVRPPLPKGIDPLRARPDRKATRGR